MVETEEEGMQAQAPYGVIAIAIFHIATHRVSHVGSMHTDLVLTSCLQLIFHQRMIGGSVKHMEMGNGIFSTIVDR